TVIPLEPPVFVQTPAPDAANVAAATVPANMPLPDAVLNVIPAGASAAPKLTVIGALIEIALLMVPPTVHVIGPALVAGNPIVAVFGPDAIVRANAPAALFTIFKVPEPSSAP